jgi:hypothetical protein
LNRNLRPPTQQAINNNVLLDSVTIEKTRSSK